MQQTATIKTRDWLTVPQGLLLAFFLLEFFGSVLIPSTLLRNAFLGCLGLVILIYMCVKHSDSAVVTSIIVFSLFASLAMLSSLLLSHNSSIEDLFWIWVFAGPVLVLLTEDVSFRLFSLAFYIIVPILLILCLSSGNAELVFASSSRNLVSATAIFFAAMLYIFEKEQRGKVHLLPAAITLLTCVVAIGRSGIIFGSILFVIVYIEYCITVGLTKLKAIITIVLITSCLLCVFIESDIVQIAIQNFERRQLVTPRTVLWELYLGLLNGSPENIAFGAPLSGSPYIEYYKHLHNSFFMLHAKFGLIGLLFVLVGLMNAIVKKIRHREFFVAAILVVAIGRCIFDWCAFTGVYDILFLYTVFDSVISKRQNSRTGAVVKKRLRVL